MRRLWRHLRQEKPTPLALLVFLGINTILSGTTAWNDNPVGHWLGIGLIAGGVVYVLLFSTLFVLARRDRKRQPVDHAESS